MSQTDRKEEYPVERLEYGRRRLYFYEDFVNSTFVWIYLDELSLRISAGDEMDGDRELNYTQALELASAVLKAAEYIDRSVRLVQPSDIHP